MEYPKDKIMENKKDLNGQEENIELVESIIISKKEKDSMHVKEGLKNPQDEMQKLEGSIKIEQGHKNPEENKQNPEESLKIQQYLKNPNEEKPNVENKDEKMILINDQSVENKVNEKKIFQAVNDNQNEHEMTDIDIENDEIDDRFREEIDALHPRKINENGELEKYPCCSTNTGFFTCSNEGLKCDMDPFGIGIIVYFKILKSLLICFFFISIFNISLIYIYSQTNKVQINRYQDALYATSIGNIHSTFQNGYSISYSNIIINSSAINNYNYIIPLNCSTYNITNLLYFGLSLTGVTEIQNRQVCANFSSGYDLTLYGCTNAFAQLKDQTSKNCLNKTTCNLTYNYLNFVNDCSPSGGINNSIFISYNCFQGYIDLPYGNKIDRSLFAYAVVFIDIASMLTLLITINVIPIQQRRNEKFYKENITQISDYTLHIEKLDVNTNEIMSYMDNFLKHVNRVFEVEGIQHDNSPIYEINYPLLNNTKLDLFIIKNNLIEEKKDIRRKMKETDDPKDFINLKSDLDEKRLDIKKVDEEIAICSSNLTTIDDIYVTLTNQRFAGKLYEIYQITKCTRCCMIFCCRKQEIQHLYFNDKWLEIRAFPDEPSNLKWQNITYSECKRFFRQFLAIIIAFIIILISFAIVVGGKYLKDQMDNQINTDIDCTLYDVTNVTQVIQEYNSTISNVSKIMTYCYCKNCLYVNGTSATQNLYIGNVYLCKDWMNLYIQTNSLNIGIIIVIPLVNSILVIILRFLTQFERNKTVSADKISDITKIFLMQMINTGLILLLVNLNIKSIKDTIPNFPLFTGKYDDMSPAWFHDIGTTILFSLILNVFVPHLTIILSNGITICKRCCDSGCECIGQQSTLRKKEYSQLYIGPEFLIDCRYSELLTTIFVSLIYSSGLPVLYICCFTSLFLTYWVDKWMLLNFYKRPPQYDLYMSKLFNSVVLLGVVVHYIIAIWIYGNKNLLYNRNNDLLSSLSISNYLNITGTVGTNLTDRINQPHNLICLAFLLLIIVIVILRYTLFQIIIMTCCKSCTESNVDQIKTIEIGTALSLKKMVKIYNVRKMQLRKIKDIVEKKELNKFFKDIMIYEEAAIKAKLCTENEKYPELDQDFEFINKIIKEKKIPESGQIDGDYSYNFIHLPELEVAAKMEYKYI